MNRIDTDTHCHCGAERGSSDHCRCCGCEEFQTVCDHTGCGSSDCNMDC